MQADISTRTNGENRHLCSLRQFIRNRICQLLCRSGRDIVFLAVVRFGDLIVKRRQRMGNKAQRREQHIDTQRHIWRKNHADLVMQRKILHPQDVRVGIARRAEYDFGAMPLASAQNCARCSRS